MINNIVTYRLEKDDNKHPSLVAENTIKYEVSRIDSPIRAVNLVNDVFKMNKLAEEMVCMISLDNKCNVLGLFDVSHGSVDETYCSPREIYIRALISGASSIIILHNHTSGDSTPSKQDSIVYDNFVKTGKMMNIRLDDFIIIGDDYYSFNESRRNNDH